MYACRHKYQRVFYPEGEHRVPVTVAGLPPGRKCDVHAIDGDRTYSIPIEEFAQSQEDIPFNVLCTPPPPRYNRINPGYHRSGSVLPKLPHPDVNIPAAEPPNPVRSAISWYWKKKNNLRVAAVFRHGLKQE